MKNIIIEYTTFHFNKAYANQTRLTPNETKEETTWWLDQIKATMELKQNGKSLPFSHSKSRT